MTTATRRGSDAHRPRWVVLGPDDSHLARCVWDFGQLDMAEWDRSVASGRRVTIRARYVTYLGPPSLLYGIVADDPLPPEDC